MCAKQYSSQCNGDDVALKITPKVKKCNVSSSRAKHFNIIPLLFYWEISELTLCLLFVFSELMKHAFSAAMLGTHPGEKSLFNLLVCMESARL